MNNQNHADFRAALDSVAARLLPLVAEVEALRQSADARPAAPALAKAAADDPKIAKAWGMLARLEADVARLTEVAADREARAW